MDVLLAYHRHTVEGLILVMILNLLFPQIVKSNFVKMVLFSRIGFFLFWTLWSMVAFTGLIVLVFSRMDMTQEVWFMVALILILPLLDGYRAVRINQKYWTKGEDGRLFSGIVGGFELILTLAMMIVAMG
jgi:general stress protein CsbA